MLATRVRGGLAFAGDVDARAVFETGAAFFETAVAGFAGVATVADFFPDVPDFVDFETGVGAGLAAAFFGFVDAGAVVRAAMR